MIGVTGSEDSVWCKAVCAPTINELVAGIPVPSIVVVPTTSHRTAFRRSWARQCAASPMPTVVTMPQLHTMLATEVGALTPAQRVLSDAECSVLLELAVTDADLRFSPPGLTVSRLIRWKQEAETPQHIAYSFPPEDRPPELRDLDSILKVWHAYEQRKAAVLLDRGDVSQQLVNALAGNITLAPRNLLLLATHGLSRTDRYMATLLQRLWWDVGITFCAYMESQTRSMAEAQWLVAHGWNHVCSYHWQAPSITAHAMPSAREEVRRVLAAVKEFVTSGHDIHQACVVIPKGASYESLFEEYASAGVPLSVQSIRTAADLPQGKLLHSICMVQATNWERTYVERVACNSTLPPTDALLDLQRVASTLRIAGGKGAKEWVDRIAAQDVLDTAMYDAVNRLKKSCDLLPTHCSTDDFAAALHRILNNFGQEMHPAVAAACSAYEQLSLRLNIPQLSLPMHIEQWWQRMLTSQTHGTVCASNALDIVYANELRMQRYSVVFALGLTDGMLPQFQRDTADETILGISSLELELEQWADIQQAAVDGTLIATWPTTVDEDEALQSQFLLGVNTAQPAPFTSLQNLSAELLLTPYDAQCYRDGVAGVAGEFEAVQSGLDASLVNHSHKAFLEQVENASVSPTRLDDAIACPYKYFAAHVLRLQQADVTEQSITPLERGRLLHEVAQRFFDEVRGHSVTIEQIQSVQDLLDASISIAEYPIAQLLPMLERIYTTLRKSLPVGYLYHSAEQAAMLDTNGRPGLLHRWLATEHAWQQNSELRPVLFEVPFRGNLDLGFGSEPISLRIDRIDVASVSGGIQLGVVDYKSTGSSIPTHAQIAAGYKTQPLLYIKAAQALLANRNINVVEQEMRYHTFGNEVYSDKDPSIKTVLPPKKKRNTDGNASVPAGTDPNAVQSLKNDVTEFVDSTILKTHDTIRGIRNAQFAVLPKDYACKSCAYNELCAIENWGAATINATENI